ncbi:MAG: hypothetical protein ACFFDY_14405 [Candidatus Thorarchaeota archaeon]
MISKTEFGRVKSPLNDLYTKAFNKAFRSIGRPVFAKRCVRAGRLLNKMSYFIAGGKSRR